MTEDLEVDWFFSALGWVLLAVSSVLEAEEDVQFPLDSEVGISSSHSGKRLDN